MRGNNPKNDDSPTWKAWGTMVIFTGALVGLSKRLFDVFVNKKSFWHQFEKDGSWIAYLILLGVLIFGGKIVEMFKSK